MKPRLLIALSAISIACSDSARPALIFEIRSPLSIPSETNALSARVMSEGSVLREETYALGSPPRDQWPQTLPVVSGAGAPKEISLVLELRRANADAPADVVGFAVAPATFPASGEERIPIDVPRACRDDDNDGFGFGLGCRGIDCDDRLSSAPDPNPCAPPPDAGVDGGVDLGAGEDVVAVPDVGFDGGVPRPDVGPPCGDGGTCAAEEICFADACRDPCTRQVGCPDPNQICLDTFNVCFCRYPCNDRPGACGGVYACIDGCCQIN